MRKETVFKKIPLRVGALLLIAVLLCVSLTGCKENTIIVHTNAFFAPFEYYVGEAICGVDVEIMGKVGEKLGLEVEFENVDFAMIVDNVAEGKVCDCGAAGITITDAREEKVAFSIPYYSSMQYVIFTGDCVASVKETPDGERYLLWNSLAGYRLGVQNDTTAWIFADSEIHDETGVLYGTNTMLTCFDTAQLATDAIGAQQVDFVILDRLPAEFIVSRSEDLHCIPLYSAGEDGGEDVPVQEQYAICVNKKRTELLDAINAILQELIDSGEIDRMIMHHMGLE